MNIYINNIAKWKVSTYDYLDPQMGLRSISLTVNHPSNWIDGDAVEVADFTDAYVMYKGEKFKLSISKPTAEKKNSTLDYEYKLVFKGSEDELTRRKVRDLAEVGVNKYISQGTSFSLSASIQQFKQLLDNNLKYYFGSDWNIIIAGDSQDSARIDINNTSIWELLQKTYEYYGLRWNVKNKTITIGYEPVLIDHVFDYGKEGGLVKITRTAQDDSTPNRITGTGGSRNLPKNYFTNRYSDFRPDPDVISDSVNIKNLMPKVFRDSVRSGTLPYIDYVEDEQLVALNGVIEDALAPNEDIYPSIAGVEVAGLGRIDEIIYSDIPLYNRPEEDEISEWDEEGNPITPADNYSPTFDIWVKDIGFDLADEKYTSTEEAKISFTTGDLAGYEFTILATGGVRHVSEDTSKSHNGVQSKYRITLIKSDEDYDATGRMLPNTVLYPKVYADGSADSFVIYDIEMPQSYVENAELRLQRWLEAQLEELKTEKPTYAIEIMPSFFKTAELEFDGVSIEDKLEAGNLIRVMNASVTGEMQTLHINNLTVEYKDLLPKYRFTVTDKVSVDGNAVGRLQSQLDAVVSRQLLTEKEIDAILSGFSTKFLSKIRPDIAQQFIQFLKGISVEGLATFLDGLTSEGLATFVDGLTAEGLAKFNAGLESAFVLVENEATQGVVQGLTEVDDAPVALKMIAQVFTERMERTSGAETLGDLANVDESFDTVPDAVYSFRKKDGKFYPILGGGGAGGESGILFRMRTISPNIITVAESDKTLIKYTWSSIDVVEGVDTGMGTLEVSVAGRTVRTGVVSQGDNSVDVAEYLRAGENDVSIKVVDSYGNSRVLTYVVNLVSLRISSSYDPSTINEGEITFRYTPIGSILKTAHFIINGVEVATREIPTSGSQITQLLPAQAHGTHSLRVYLSANIDAEVRSNELYYDIISIEEGRTETLIASTFDTATMIEFETLSIPYVVYNPLSNNSSVQLKVDGEVVQDVIVDRRLQTWSYKAMSSGFKTLEIISNGVSKTINLTVTESEINVRPEESDLKLFLTSQNRSNQQLNKEKWEFDTIKAQLTGFDFATNGWIRDSEGSMALKVSNDAKVVIPYKMFATEFRNSGKTIEFEFMATEMKNSDVPLISSIYGDITEEVVNGELQIIDRRIGFEISPQKAYFGSEQTSITTNFKENERVRVSFVVDKSSEDRLVKVYVNGILSGVQQYPNTDNFTQIVPQNITIGNKECAVLVYNIRVYDNNLTQYQLLDNYIGDMDNTDKKIEVYYRNQLYDAYGNINYDRALQYVPCMIIEGKLPESKGDKRPVNVYYENLQDPSKSYTSTNAQIDVQGTSSQYYPRKNWKIKHNNGFTTSEGFSSKYKLRDNSIPEKTFTMKADFAESSGVHNTGLAVYYEWAWRQLGFRVPTQDAGYANDVRTTIDGFPCLIFHRESPDSYLEFTGKYNFNNDKTEATFGFKPGMVSWEVRNNTSPRVLFESADFESLDIHGKPDWLNDYEDRYPDDGYDNPFKLKRLTEWIISCTDNPDKFANEVNDYFDVNSLLFYYVMTEVTAGIDQRAKNMFLTWYSEDEYDTDKCYLIFYDNDTVLGINNEGAMSFGYGVEYHDKIRTGSGASNVWNAESSVLWDLVERGLSEQINDLYARMRAENVISYERFRYFLDDIHSSKWSESIYNEDGMFKYINPLLEDGNGAYLYALQGSREEHRKWWLYNRVLYMDSKYTTATHLSDYASMRLYTPPSWQGVAPNPDFALTALGDTYARVKFGSYIIKKRIKGNTTVEIKAPTDMVFNDTETIVYGARALTSIGDLSDKYVGTLDTSKAPNLTELIVGSTASGYKNQNLTALTVGNNNLLTKLNIANCSNLTQSINLKGCPSIREIEATGSRITSVELPDGGNLSYLSLPGVASMAIRRQQKLTNENIKLDNYGNLTTLIIENCPLINPFDIINKSENLNRVRLIGLDGSSNDDSVFNVLEKLKGVDIDGNTTPISYIEGKWHLDSISKTDFNRYKALWLDFNLTADEVILMAKMTFNKAIGFTNEISVISSESFNFRVNYGENRQNYDLVDGVLMTIHIPNMEYSNTAVNMLDADKLTSLGDLSSKYLGSFDISETPNFKEVIIGSNKAGYSNEYFSELNLGENNTTLEVLNIVNCVNYTGILDLSECVNIKEIQAGGTKVSELVINSTTQLNKLHLGGHIEDLRLKNQLNLSNENFNLDGVDNLKIVSIDNCPLINSFDVISNASNLTNVRVNGLAVEDNKDLLIKLLALGGVDENGNLIEQSYLEGTWNFYTLTYTEFIEFSMARPNLEVTVDYLIDDTIMTMNFKEGFNGDFAPLSTKSFDLMTFYGSEEPIITPLVANTVGSVVAPDIEYSGTIVKITGANLLSTMGTLSNKYLGYIDISKTPNFKELVLGSTNSSYSNPYLVNVNLGENNTVLETLNVANCPNFEQALDLSIAPNIKTLVASGTKIKSLKIKNNSNLTTVTVSTLESLSVENSIGVNVINILENNSLIDKLRWIGVDATENLSKWVSLADSNIQGINADGTICPLGDAIVGKLFIDTIDEDNLDKLQNAFPNLNVTYNTITSPPFEFADPEVGRVLHANELIASPTHSTREELATITSLNPSASWNASYFYNNKIITQFPELKYFTGVTNLSYTFSGCSSLTTAPVIPEGVTNLRSTFYGCSSLTTAPVIPEGVTDLYETFYRCSSLTTAPDIPEGVTNLRSTFYGCSSLTTAPVIPEGVTDLTQTFYGCSNLLEAPVIPEGVTNLSYTFSGCSSLTTAPVIPEGVTNLTQTFYGCSNLLEAPDIPEGVTNLRSTFSGCSSLTTAPVIPEGVTNLSYTFRGCSSLTTAPVIPEGVTDLTQTFYGCSNLLEAPVIPEGVTNLSYTFSGCSSIDGIYIINIVTPPTYSNSLYRVQAIYVPDDSVSKYKVATGWIQFADKIFPMSTKP